MQDIPFKNDKEKLSYIIRDILLKKNKELEIKLGFQSNVVSEILNKNSNRTLQKYHIYAILFLYNLPQELFNSSSLNSRKKVKLFLENNQPNKTMLIHHIHIENLEKLIGTWYAYHYPDSLITRLKLHNSLESGISYVYEEVITVNQDFNIVSNLHGVGKLHIHSHQSNIIFENKDTKDIIEYTFDNDQINNYQFDFIKLSKMKHSKRKILNVGFFSKKSLNENEAQVLLGEDVSKMQFKIDLDFIERLSAYNEIKDF